MKTYSESRNELRTPQVVKKMLEKSIKSVFVIRAALWAEKLGRCLEYQELEVIQFKFRMKGALATVEICVLCGWRFLNHFDVVSETPCSCDTVDCEL